MEMHQAREEEMVEAYNTGNRSRSWADTNLLAGNAVALEHLHALYRHFHSRVDTPSGAYEATSLMRPCNGLKRGLRSERVGRGVRSEPSGFAARDRREPTFIVPAHTAAGPGSPEW